MKPASLYLLIILLAIQCVVIGGCKKSSSDPECETIDYTDAPPHGYNIVTVGKHLRSACFNPNNEDEFVFWSLDEGAAGSTLYIFNYKTSQIRKLLEIDLRYPPKWGSNGWILLGVGGGHIGKVKPDGDSLTNITQGSGSFHHPNWNTTCTQILATLYAGLGALLTSDGQIIDTIIKVGGTESNFIDDDRIIANGDWAGVYTISTDEYDRIAPAHEIGASGGQMVTDEEFIWADELGIYRTNIVTRQTTTLKTTCDAVMYLFPSVNKSRTKVLWMRLAQQVKGDDLRQDYEIVEMNPDGTGEREIPIPE